MLGRDLQQIDDMPAEDVLLWRTWLAMEPRGERRADYRAAQVSQAVYSVIASFSGGKAPQLSDNLLKFKRDDRGSKNQQMLNAQAALKAFGGMFTDGASLKRMQEDIKKLRQS